jgi:O-antigen ligase
MLRFFRSWIRTPIMIAAEASQYIILGVFTGLLYFNASLNLPNAPSDRMSSIFLLLTLLMFVPSYTALVVWDYERGLLRRESETGTYRR